MPDSPDSHPNFQALFSQLQSRYPTSSLITELVHVQNGSFTVRAVVQTSGTPLATSMASAPTVEQAEDHARLRLLHVLGLSPELHQGLRAGSRGLNLGDLNNGLSREALTAPSVPAMGLVSPVSAPFSSDSTVTQSELLADPVGESLASGNLLELRSRPTALPSPPLPDVTNPPTVFEFSEADAPSVPQPVYAFGSSANLSNGVPQPADTAADATAVIPATKARPSKVKASTATTAEAALAESPKGESPKGESLQPEVSKAAPLQDESLQTESPKAIADPISLPVIDLTPIFLQIEDEMERIGWTKAQGRSHLKTAYGKRSRQELTDEELTDFLSHLQSCPSAVPAMLED